VRAEAAVAKDETMATNLRRFVRGVAAARTS
jgi:hypothetical protein